MLRLVLLSGSLALAAGPALADGEPGPYSRVRPLPPEIAYRDPAYIPSPPLRAVVAAPVFAAPRPLNLPLYNEPPMRFPTP